MKGSRGFGIISMVVVERAGHQLGCVGGFAHSTSFLPVMLCGKAGHAYGILSMAVFCLMGRIALPGTPKNFDRVTRQSVLRSRSTHYRDMGTPPGLIYDGSCSVPVPIPSTYERLADG